MAIQSYEDIYQYHFKELYKLTRSLIGKAALSEDGDDDEDFPSSNLLFDVGGIDFNRFKAYETEYRCWVEIHILKMVQNLLNRKKIWFEERYYGDGTEQNSIVISPNGNLIEAYFLFDITYENANNTDYDQLSAKLMERAHNVDEINIFIFRDAIGYFDLANLVNGNPDMNGNGFVKIFTLQDFFELFFGNSEYQVFLKYANDFYQRCNQVIS